MTLQLTALDAIVGGIATAFFGGLLAGDAYLLKQQLSLREQVTTLAHRVEILGAVRPALEAAGLESLGLGMGGNPEKDEEQGES